MSATHLNRRQFLVGTGGLAAAGSVMAACGGGGSDAAKPRKAVTPPTHVPFGSIKPDLPAGPGGVPAAYFRYPSKPATLVPSPPAKGGDIGMMLEALSIATPESRNQWWQALNKSLGTKIKYQITPSANYLEKFQVTVAGNEFPDIAQIVQIRDMPQVLDRLFTDLSPHLSGDAIKKYPGLASIPQEAWQISTVNGRIWGIPQYRPTAGLITSYRGDILDKLGVKPDINSGADFLDFCKEVSSVKAHQWAFGTSPTNFILPFILEMMGAPNGWAQKGGKFTSVNESEQMKDALDTVAKMWKAGYIHPDSIASPDKNYTWWSGGTTVLYIQSFAGWSSYQTSYPTWNLGVVAPAKWDGGGLASKFLGLPGYPDFAAFKKTGESRVKELLEVCNLLAAPFGTKEYLTVNYGVEGHDYTVKNGNLTPTESAPAEQMPITYVGSQRFVSLYMPNDPDSVKAQHKFLSDVLPGGISNPSQGLYSETNLTKGASAAKNLTDLQAAIIQGRKPVSAWDDGVKAWRSEAGDKIRTEFEAAYAKVN